MAKRRFYGKRYTSGDNQIDWIFRKFIWLLETKINQVVFTTPLRDPDKPKKYLRGLWIQDDRSVPYGQETITFEKLTIYIDPKYHKKNGEDVITTFIHELAHVLFPSLQERDIRREENILYQRFSQAQKKVLQKFFPK